MANDQIALNAEQLHGWVWHLKDEKSIVPAERPNGIIREFLWEELVAHSNTGSGIMQ